MLYSIYTPMAASTCLVISGYGQCPPTVTCSILYILLWLFQHVWLYQGMFGYIWVYSMSLHHTTLYSVHNLQAVSTCLVISWYIQCPLTVACSILYILLRRFQHVRLYLGMVNVLPQCNMLYSLFTPMAVSTCLVISGYGQCPPTVTCSILYILLWLLQHVWLYLGMVNVLRL